MNLSLLLLLLGAATMVVALPVEEDKDEDARGLVQLETLNDKDDMAQTEGSTGCSSRVHKVYYYLQTSPHTPYKYNYRACFNDVLGILCYDARETLPKFCPFWFKGQDCVVIVWKIHGNGKTFEICDRFGKPCQKPIIGMKRSTASGECTSSKELETAEVMGEDCLCVKDKNGKKKCTGACELA